MSTNAFELPAISLLPRDHPKIGEQISLQEIFKALISCSKLDIHVSDVRSILTVELNVKTEQLTQQVLNVLIDAVFYYFKCWDGWKRRDEYLSRTLSHKKWFQSFYTYLSFKCNHIIQNAEEYIKECESVSSDGSTQTETRENDVQLNIKECPYKLVIGGSPSILNNIAFLIRDENLFIKQHDDQPFPNLTMLEFLNWPDVSVELKLPDIHFERKNTHKFYRYISCDGTDLTMPDVVCASDNPLITHVTKTSKDGKPYTLLFIWQYFMQLIGSIKKHLELKINANRLQQIEMLSHQFIQDIREMNIADASMCSNATVGFRIGSSRYTRHKQMKLSDKDKKHSSEGKNIVNLMEIMMPQVECTLHYIKAEQDLNDAVSVTFKGLNSLFRNVDDPNNRELAKFVDYINNKCLSYSCNFCKETFTDSAASESLVSHFEQHHKSGYPLVCRLCGKQFPIKLLAGQRWKHICI